MNGRLFFTGVTGELETGAGKDLDRSTQTEDETMNEEIAKALAETLAMLGKLERRLSTLEAELEDVNAAENANDVELGFNVRSTLGAGPGEGGTDEPLEVRSTWGAGPGSKDHLN